MSDNNTIDFTTVDEFNKIFSELIDDAYAEFVKLSQFFSKIIQ